MTKRHTLVWLQSPTGPKPEIWAPDYFALYRRRSEPVIISTPELTDAERIEPLSVLARRYPPPRL